ncbi:MAG: tetratricopeptide repeat protein [Planctomycetota bacterium]|nr:tetratricopeptide repeat protein [Planctomycetota bacterium]
MNQLLRRRAKAIFHEALDRPPTERRAFVRETTRDERELETVVLELLAAHDGAGDFLGSPTLGEPRMTQLAGEEHVGLAIGHYVLCERIGEGGFGVVWRAEQKFPVRREVALKVIKLGMDTKAVVARFEAERQALALMDHPSIARVFDGGATAQGRPFFVMELVRGVPITNYCDEHLLSTRQRLAIFTTVCRAVQHAHQKGVIHRDIKPGNVLVVDEDLRPVPKVIDFGIAKATSARLSERTFVTEARQFIGTPEYMAPEQTSLSGIDIDTRADVYSLGVLLYELLSGEKPFRFDRLREDSWDEVVRTIREVEPERPSARVSTIAGEERTTLAKEHATRDLARLLSGDLDWIVMKALEKDRERRYDTALALAEDVERHLENLPVLARPPSRTYRFAKLVRRNRLAFAAAGVVFIALVAGIGAASYGLVEAREQREIAQKEARSATARLQSRNRVTQFLSDMLKGAGPSVAMGRDATILREILQNTKGRLDVELSGESEVRASLLDIMGRVHVELGDIDEAVRMHTESLRLWRAISPEPGVDVAVGENNLAAALLARSHLDEAEIHAREAFRIAGHVTQQDEPVAYQIRNTLGLILLGQGRAVEAEEMLRSAMQLEHDSAHLVVSKDFDARVNFAELLRRRGRATEAEAMLAELVSESRDGTEHPRTLLMRSNRAAVLLDLGRYEEARAECDVLLTLLKKVDGPRSVGVASTLLNMAKARKHLGDVSGALADFDEAIAVFRENGPRDWDAIARALCRRGRLLMQMDRTDAAEGSLEEGVAMYERLAGPANSDWAGGLSDRSELRMFAKDFAGADGDLKRALEIATDEDARSHLVAEILGQQGGQYLNQGRFAESALAVERAVTLSREIPSVPPAELATMISNLAIARFRAGDSLAAETAAREAFEMRERLGVGAPERSLTAFWRSRILSELGRYDEAKECLEKSLVLDLEAAGTDEQFRSRALRTAALIALRARAFDWTLARLREARALDVDSSRRTLERFGQEVSTASAFETIAGSPENTISDLRECVTIAELNAKDPATAVSFRFLLAAQLVDVAGVKHDLAAAREALDLALTVRSAREQSLSAGDWRLRYARCIAAAADAEVARNDPSVAEAERRTRLESAAAVLEKELPSLLAVDGIPQPVLSLRAPTATAACARIHETLATLVTDGKHAAAAKRWQAATLEVRTRPQN